LLKWLTLKQPDLENLFGDVLELRNDRVNQCIMDCLPSYENILVPWGAAHMPGIERSILESGGVIVERRTIPIGEWFPKIDESVNSPDAGDG
jgi:hypothetical protein